MMELFNSGAPSTIIELHDEMQAVTNPLGRLGRTISHLCALEMALVISDTGKNKHTPVEELLELEHLEIIRATAGFDHIAKAVLQELQAAADRKLKKVTVIYKAQVEGDDKLWDALNNFGVIVHRRCCNGLARLCSSHVAVG